MKDLLQKVFSDNTWDLLDPSTQKYLLNNVSKKTLTKVLYKDQLNRYNRCLQKEIV